MSESEPRWDLFGAFLAVMQGGSLSAAARTLRVAQPTVRRQIETLERQLGVVLFTRGPNGLVPTDLAMTTLPHAESIAASTRAIARSLSGGSDGDSGTVRIACSEIVGLEVLPAMLADLSAQHPRLQLELSLSNRNEDLLRRDADVAVRMVRPTQQGLRIRGVGEIELGLYATAGYLARRPAPEHPRNLAEGHALIGADRLGAFIEALDHAGIPTRRRDFTVRTDSDAAQLAAVRAGIGIGVCQVPIARRDASLVRVLPKFRLTLPTFLVMHEDLRGTPRVRLVFDHLAAALVQYAGRAAPRTANRRSGR